MKLFLLVAVSCVVGVFASPVVGVIFFLGALMGLGAMALLK